MSRNMSFAERSVYAKSLLKLNQQGRIIEQESVATIANMKIDMNILQDILHNLNDISVKRQNFLEMICKSLHDIILELKFVKTRIGDPKQMQKLDINAYKLRLIKLSQKIQEYKKYCLLQSLAEEQIALDAQLSKFTLNMKKYDTPKNGTIRISHCKEIKQGKLDYKEAQDFHVLVAQTGHTGNWSEEDHLLFLKMRKKCNSIPGLVTAMQTKCPDLSAEMIVNHESWYKVYVELREKQKSMLREWKKHKEFEKMKKLEEHDKNIQETPKCKEIQATPVQKEMVLQDRMQEPRTEIIKSKDNTISNRNETKELIKKWKTEKEMKRSMDAEQLRMQLKLKQDREEAQRRKRLRNIQEALCEYRKKKSVEDNFKVSNESSKEKCKSDSRLIKAYRKQDKEYTERRKNMITNLRDSNKCQPIHIQCSTLLKTKHSSTLLNATKVWQEKCKMEKSTHKESNELQYIKDVPRLCTRWRNEESVDLKSSLACS